MTLSEGLSSSALTAFVILPFAERDSKHPKGFFAEVLRSIITPAAKDFRVKTDNRQGSDVIQSTIISDLIEADLVIADLTEHNPNVMFELGVRMAQDKPVVLMKAEGTGPLFDVDNMLRVFEYSPNFMVHHRREGHAQPTRVHQGRMGESRIDEDLHEDIGGPGKAVRPNSVFVRYSTRFHSNLRIIQWALEPYFVRQDETNAILWNGDYSR